jgi:cob(I)alamin adenosyltransferase
MSICTKSGDDGTTGLIGDRRVCKDDPVMECLGTIDELNSFLGSAKAAAAAKDRSSRVVDIITAVQKDLFNVSGILAGSGGSVCGEERLCQLIAELESKLPAFTAFTMPGANEISAKLHIARTVCRRAERRLVSLSHAEKIDAGLLPYFNRLSDLLFLLAQSEEQA